MRTRLEERINRWTLIAAAVYFTAGMVLSLLKGVSFDSILIHIGRWLSGL